MPIPADTADDSGTDGTQPHADCPEVIPPGTRCISCRYDLSGGRPGPCPECGTHIGAPEIERWHKRVAWERTFPIRRYGLAAFVLPPLYALGAWLFGGNIGPGLGALIVITLTVAGSIVTGELLAHLGDPLDRRLTRRVWLRSNTLIQFPWLAIGPAAGIALAAAYVERALDGGGTLLFGVTVIGAILWFSGSIGFLIVACGRLGSVRSTRALRWTPTQIAVITIAVLLQFPANCIAGFIGGMLAGFGAAELTGIDWWSDFD